MGTLYLAVSGTVVFGMSFGCGSDAIDVAREWVESEGDKFVRGDYSVVSIDVPDTATESDFDGCADVSEYRWVVDSLC